MKRKILLLFTLLQLQFFIINAQECNYKLEGKVYDLNRKVGLEAIKVEVKGEQIGTLSDENGSFIIEGLCEKEYDLVFSSFGYKTLTHHHDFHHPFLEIYMAPDTLTLESIAIEASRNQADLNTITTSRLSEEALARVSTGSLGEVVSKIAGVEMLSTGSNIAKPIIHGLHSNRVLVMNNGVRHEFQNWGQDHAPEIDPSLANDVQVIKGAATVRFGPDALGGVILINPPKMELSTPLRASLELTGQSNGRSGEGTFEISKGFKWFSLIGGTSYVKQGDLHAPDYSLTNTGREELSYFGGFRIHPFAELDIEAYYSHFDQELGILRGSVFGNLDDLERAIRADVPLLTEDFSYDINRPRQEVAHDLYKASIQYTGQNQSISLQYAYQFNHRQEFGVRRSDAPNIDLELRTESVDFDWIHPKLGNLSGKIGFQWQAQENDNLPGTNTVPFIPNYESSRYGGFIIESLKLGKNALELGLRYDYLEADIVGREPDNTIYRNTIRYRNVSATIGYEHKLGEYSTLRSNFGTAWRPPNVAELYRFGQHFSFIEYGLWRYTIDERFDFVTTSEGILDESDREVPSEVGYKWINTFTLNKSNFQLDATAYINYIENFIYAKPAGLTNTPRGFFVFFIYDQADALFWGLDLASTLKHSPIFSSSLQASYLWSQQIADGERDNFAGQPPAKVEYGLTIKPKVKFLDQSELNISTSYTFEQFMHPRILTIEEFLFAAQNGIDRFVDDASDFDLIPPPAGFFLTHLSWKVNFHKLEWRFQVRNLFNTSYRSYTNRMRYFADEMGRNFILSLKYKF